VSGLPQLVQQDLADHRLDGREWFRAVVAGQLGDQAVAEGNEKHQHYYELAGAHDLDVPSQQERIFRSIAARIRAARHAIQAARDRERGTDVPASPSLEVAA
jgi:hypothetical protein